MSFNTAVSVAGASPLPQATLQVYNPNATAVAVTGIQLQMFNASGQPIPGGNLPTPAMGPGQNVVAATLSSITFGPFPLAVGSAAAASGFGSVPIPALTGNTELAQPPQVQVLLGGVVYGSDGSINIIVPAGVTISYTSTPALLSQGGVINFTQGSNLLTGLVMGVL